MGMNRVQFQRGLSLPQFLRRFGTREQCLNALERARWPAGFRCPHCAGRAGSRFERGSQRLWQCQGCRKQTSVTAGTVLADTKLPLSTWLMALYFVAHAKNGIAALELSRHLGVCYRTAWRMKHKLMAALSGGESGRLLRGVVEVDDAYLGGERSGLPKGQQWQNKVPFVAAVDTHDGRPIHARFDCVSSFRRETMAHWARTALAPQARRERRLVRICGRDGTGYRSRTLCRRAPITPASSISMRRATSEPTSTPLTTASISRASCHSCFRLHYSPNH